MSSSKNKMKEEILGKGVLLSKATKSFCIDRIQEHSPWPSGKSVLEAEVQFHFSHFLLRNLPTYHFIFIVWHPCNTPPHTNTSSLQIKWHQTGRPKSRLCNNTFIFCICRSPWSRPFCFHSFPYTSHQHHYHHSPTRFSYELSSGFSKNESNSN